MSIVPPAYISLSVPLTASGGASLTNEELKTKVFDVVKNSKVEDRDRAFNTIMDSDKNISLVKEHIETLAIETLSVRAAFEEILHLLKDFDEMKFKDENNKEMAPIQNGWDALHIRYNALLDISKSDAVLIKGVCDKYIQIILAMLDDKSVTKEALLKELDYFIKETEKKQKSAKSDADAWDQLRLDVLGYQKTIEHAFSVANAGVDKTAVKNEIARLELKIAEAQKFINGCWIAGGVGLAATVGGAILCCFCPLAAILFVGGLLTMTGSAIALSVKQSEMNTDKEELKKQQLELTRLENLEAAREKKLTELRQQLADSQGKFTTITRQLAALANFWQSVQSDLAGALTHIGDIDPKEVSIYGLKSRAGPRLAGSVYIVLSQVLGTYISQMTKLEENKPN